MYNSLMNGCDSKSKYVQYRFGNGSIKRILVNNENEIAFLIHRTGGWMQITDIRDIGINLTTLLFFVYQWISCHYRKYIIKLAASY